MAAAGAKNVALSDDKPTKKGLVLGRSLWEGVVEFPDPSTAASTERGGPVPKRSSHPDWPDTTRDEVVHALLHADRSHHDELGRTRSTEINAEAPYHSSPREQAAAPIDLHNVDE
jgi:hypothetical protein